MRYYSTKARFKINLTNDDIKKYYMLIKQSEFNLESNRIKFKNEFDSIYCRKSSSFKQKLKSNFEAIFHEIFNIKLQQENLQIDTEKDENCVIGSDSSRVKYYRSLISGIYFKDLNQISQTQVLNFYKYLQIEKSDLSPNEKEKLYNGNKLNIEFHNLSSDSKQDFKLKLFNDYISKGLDLNGDRFLKFRYNNIIGLDIPPNGFHILRKIPDLNLNMNLNTGRCVVNTIDPFFIYNYYLTKRLNQLDQTIPLSDKIKEINSEYPEVPNLYNEVLQFVQSGHFYHFGEIEKITSISKNIHNYIKRNPYKIQIETPNKPKIILNQTSGSIIPIYSNVDNDDAFDYYTILNKQIPSEDILRNWSKLKKSEKLNVLAQYKQLLSSGYDMYLGEVIPTKEKVTKILSNDDHKFSKRQKSKFIIEIFGQVYIDKITSSTLEEVLPIPYVINPKTRQVEILKKLNHWYGYNYYLGRKLKDESLKQIENEWESKSNKEKDQVLEEYVNLIKSGKDLLYGEVVDIESKIKKSECIKKLSKLKILNIKQLFLRKDNEKRGNDEEIYEYFKSLKSRQNLGLDEIQSEWTKLTTDEIEEVRNAYELYLTSHHDSTL